MIAGASADIAAHDDHATGHALLVAGQTGAEEIPGVALNDDVAVFQLTGPIGIDGTLNDDASALHLHAKIAACAALDRDLPLGHAPADEVQFAGRAAQHDVAGVVALDIEQITGSQLTIAGLQQDIADFGGALALQRVRGQGRGVDPLPGFGPQRQNQHGHAMISCRWKRNGPSLPP